MEQLAKLLNDNKLTIAAYESFTGGYFASLLTSYPGVSSYFSGSLVAYNKNIKIKVGNVSKKIIEKYGVISSQTAEDMAKKCQKLFNTSIAVSFTGNAGPTGDENKPVGEVHMGIIIHQSYYGYDLHCDPDLQREGIKKHCADFIIEKLILLLSGKEIKEK